MTVRLDALLQPGESVRFGASKPAVWPGYAIFTVVAVLALPVVTLGIAAAAGMIRPLPFVLAAGIGGGVMLVILLAYLFDRAGPRLLVTERRVIWRSGVFRRGVLSHDRADIRSADAYEGNGVLRLHLIDGTMHRITWIDGPGTIARTLGCPARIWRARPEPARPLAVRLLTLAALLMPLVFYEFSLFFNYFRGIDTVVTKAISIGCTVLAAVLASHLLYWTTHAVAARLMAPEALRAFACWQLNRTCRGSEPLPEAGGAWWQRLERAYTSRIVRRFYGGRLDCDCEAEVIDVGKGAAA